MRKLSKKQKRTTIIISAMCIFLLVLAGWFVWRVYTGSIYGTADTNGNVRLKTYTDTAHFYRLEYPMTFLVSVPSGCCDESQDWSVASRPVTFRAPNYPEQSFMTINADASPDLANKVHQDWTSTYQKPAEVTINGNKAEYVQSTHGTDVNAYTDHSYLISGKGSGSVFVEFRQRHQRNVESLWDASGNLPTFEAMVRSIVLL